MRDLNPAQGLAPLRPERTARLLLTDRHDDFFKVTEDALVYTAEALKFKLTPETRKDLPKAYLTLEPWPDAVDALAQAGRASGRRPNLSPSPTSARRC